MRRKDILDLVGQAITQRLNPGPHKYYIYWEHDHIACGPMYCIPPPEICFGVFSNATLETGLSSYEWDVLEQRILTFLSQKGLL